MCYSPRFRGWAWGLGVMWAKNRPGHAREVEDHPSVVNLNFCGHLGGQTGEKVRTVRFRVKSLSYSQRFWGWAWGPGVLYIEN